MRTFVYQITANDVGKIALKYISCPTCKKTEVIQVSRLLGKITNCDIGKKIYRVNGVYQVENQEQLNQRQQ